MFAPMDVAPPEQQGPTASAETSPRFLALGDGNEVLQVALAPNDSVLASEHSFCYRGLGLKQEVQPLADRGSVGRTLGGWLGLKNQNMVKWTNVGTAPTYLGLAAPLPGRVIPVSLQQSGTLLVKPQTLLCSVASNQVSASTLRLTSEGAVPQQEVQMRKISGSGMCYIQAGGGAVQKKLGRSESIMAEAGCIAAVSESCKIVAEQRAGFLREPPPAQGFVVKVEGPGTVFVQATHRGRYSRTIAAERVVQRAGAGGAGDVMKAAVVTIGLVVLLLAFFDVEL